MSLFMKLALWLFVPCAVVAAGNLWAMRAFEDEWGGPNIGGGLIQLVAYLGMVLGVVFFVVALVKRRRERPVR